MPNHDASGHAKNMPRYLLNHAAWACIGPPTEVLHGASSTAAHLAPSSPAGAKTPVFLGTDGGIYKSSDGGATWLPLNGKGGANPASIGSNLFFGMDIGTGAKNNAYTYGGFQDTGCAGHRPEYRRSTGF